MEIRSWPFIIFHRDPVLLSRNVDLVDHCTATQSLQGGKRISLVPREGQNRSIRPTLLSRGNVTFVSASFPESIQRISFVSVVQKYRRFLSRDGNSTRDDAKITRLRDSALRVKDSRTRVKKRTLFLVSADVYEIARRRKIDRVGRQKGATRVKQADRLRTRLNPLSRFSCFSRDRTRLESLFLLLWYVDGVFD